MSLTGASSGFSARLAEAFSVLVADPERSEKICREVLAHSDDAGARLLLAASLRLQGDGAGALALTSQLVREHPGWQAAHFEHAMALGAVGRPREALQSLAVLARAGVLPGLWRVIGDQHAALADRAAAEAAYLRHIDAANPVEAQVREALAALQRRDRAGAARALELQLLRFPSDVLALRLLAEVYSSEGRFAEAATLLRQCLDRAPSFALARFGLASVLFHDHQLAPALEQIDELLVRDPGRLEYLRLKGETLARLGDFVVSAACLDRATALHSNNADAWAQFGHVLRTLGDREASVKAYKRAISLRPSAGDAYWGLANLKTFSFSAEDVQLLRKQLDDPELKGEDKIALLFAFAKALEDGEDHQAAFEAYGAANKARLAAVPHDRAAHERAVDSAIEFFTPSLFEKLQGLGCGARDPIFVVGMPRSGSTLVEQILSSHSGVEGTMELLDLVSIAKGLEARGPYPGMLLDQNLRALGEEYIERTRVYRRSEAPRFIDKLPNNFMHVGLIQLILPNAHVIDVRRHPLACCVSNFRQHWATGQTYAYDLTDLGAYYRNYVRLMAHFDAVLPGKVHRVIYEDLVLNTDDEVRRLLSACGLPFEAQCLRFYENKRAVRTPSSEQVRQPIFLSGMDDWRRFEPWLGELKAALGDVLDAYPAPPATRDQG
ncbi:MAG: sulfotransferase [Hyphomonadaceae bacterium]